MNQRSGNLPIRLKAAGIHLCGSLLIAVFAAALVFMVWYPSPMSFATGVAGIYLVLLGVDVCIGPLITLLVFNPAKKELKWDMTIVLLLQLSALLYGMHAVFAARPVYVVYNVGRFDLVFANNLSKNKLATVSNPVFKTLPIFGPQVIAARNPSDAKARSEILVSSLTGGDDLPQIPKYYVPYSEQTADAIKNAKPLRELSPLNKAQPANVQRLMQKYADRSADVGFLAVRGKVNDLTAVIDLHTGQLLELVALNPW